MLEINIKELFKRLCGFECELLRYINRTQGETAAPINFYEAAVALCTEKDLIRRACKRLVDAKVLIVDGVNFKISGDIFKDKEKSSEGAKTAEKAETPKTALQNGQK